MRFVPLDEAEQPSSDDRELTFIPLETSEVEQDVIGQREEDISKPFVGARNPRRQAADGRAALTDPRRLDSDTGAGIAEDVSFLAEQRRSLTKANDGRTDVSPVQIEAAAQAGMINRPKDSTPKAGAVESYMGKGLSEQEAKQNADFDAGIRSKLNKPFTPDSDGDRISVDYRPDLEADRVAREGERLAQARESVIDWNRFAKLRDYAEESPVASSLASSFASGLNVLNAPQAILNSVLELGDSLEGVMTGEKGNAAKLPKWGWTEELGKLTQAALPEAARVDLTDAWGTDQFGSVLSAKLAGNSLSMFLSLSSMLAPPLRAVLLPAMGSLATGNAYAQGDSALASVAKGAIEIGSEMLPLRAFDATMKGILNLPAPAQNQIFRLAGQKALEAGAALTINGLTGALEESVAQIGGNAVDRYMQGKNVALTEGVADAALLGGITGKILSMPAVAARASEPVSRESVAARALADELSGRDFDPATAGKAADLIFGTRSVDGSGVNRTGAALVEAERAKLNAMRTKASEDLGAAPDVDSAIAAAETMVSLPATGPVEEFVTAPHAASATLANPVPVPSSDTLEAFVNQTLQNAPAETTADAAAVNPNDTGAAAAVRATDAGVGGALPQPAGVSVADSAVQQGQPDTSGAVDAPAYSLDPRLVPVSQRAPDSVNFAPSLRVVAEDNGRSTVQLVQTPERAQDDQQAIEQLRVAVNRYNPGDGDGIQPFRDFNISDSARGRLDSLLGQFQRIAFVAEQALGVRLRYTQSLNGYGVAYKGNVFIDIPTVLNGDGKNQATGIFLFTAGHEGFHHFETSKNPEDQRVAANFKAVLRSYIKDGVVDARQAFESNANIKAGGKAVTRAYAESEVMADINGAMFIDPEFWGRLYQIDNGSTFRKVLYRMMQSLTKMINAAKKSRLDVSDLVKDVAAVREAAAQAWAQRANNQTPPAEIADEVVQYSRSGQSNFEVAPDPNNEPLSAKWNALDLGDKLRISRTVADKIVPQVLALRGASGKIVEQTGSYLNDTNPSFALRLESGDLQTVSKDLGFVLSQDSMMNISTRPFAGGSKVGAVVISIGDKSFAETKGIYDTIRSKVPEVGGQSFAEGEMVVLNYSDTTTSDLASKIDDALDKLYTVRVEEVYSSFPEKKDYDYASAAIDTGEPSQAGPDIRQRLGGIRAEATRLIEAELPSFSRAGEVTGPAEPAGRPGAGRDAGKGQTVAGAIHYGRQGGLSQLNGTSFGSGIKGAEQERLKQPGTDPRIKKRVYFYLPVAGGIAQPEIGLGAHVYSSDLSGLYDPSSMTPIRGDGNAFEVAVLDAGYRGYVNREQGTAVVLNEDVPVQYLGTADKFTKITRTPTVAKPKQMTRVEGDELVRRPEGQEVIQVVRAGNDLKFAAPSFKMQWGEARVLASEAAVADQVLKDAGSTFQFGEPQFSRDFVESPDDINDLGAFNIDTFDFDAKTDEVIDGDSMADIANEVSEMGFGVKGAVASSPTDWKKVQDKAIKGLTPEAAFPMPDFAENEFGNLTAPVYAGGTQVRLELQPYGLKDEDLWTAAIGGLRINADWGTPLSMRGASRKEAADYLQRMAAAKELTYRKFDFYKAVPAPAAKRIGEFWSAVPDIPGATEFAAGTPTVDGNSAEKLRQIAKARLLGKGYSVQVSNTADFFFMLFKNEKTGEIDEASIQIIGKPRDVGQQSVVLHAITLNKGSGIGKMFYSIANTWANVVGVKVLADPDGLTAVNSVRRTENALSAAARTKGEALIEPGWAQRVYGFDGKAKTPDAKRKNLTRIALAQARNVYELAPDFQGVRYDLDTQTFVNEDGSSADAKVKGIMSRPEVRRFSLGRTSFIRAALTNELVEGEIALPEEMGEPIMYSRTEQTETPEFKKWFGDSKVVDVDGKPLMMYHGTSMDKDFFKFKVGARGAWFTSDTEVASDYAEQNDNQDVKYNPDTRKYEKRNHAGRVMPVYLKIEKPYRLTAAEAQRVNVQNYAKAQRELFAEIKAKGYDGILWNGNLNKEWVVLGGPEQIKSAIGNNGQFDPENPDIRYSRAQLDSYMEGRNKTMPTISGAAAQEADIDLAVKAIEAVRAEIERGKRDSLPIPIGRTPHVLNMLGARQKMLRIDTGILRKVLFDKHSEDFADVTPERFVRSIYMPAMVLRGRAANEYEIVTSIVTPRGPIMVPVTDSGNSFAVMSAYAKNVGGGGESLVNRIKGGALLYADPAMAQVALTGRESAPVRGIITSGAQFPSAPPQSAQDSNVSQTDISVKPLNPYYVGWDKVRGDIIGGISSRKVKTDVDLMRRIGNLFKGDWEDAPSFSRAQTRQGQTFSLPGETRLSQTRRVLQDYFLPVLEVQRAITQQGGSITEASNVYRAEERMYGRVEETLRDFRQREFDPLIREAIDNDITMDELSLYAYAKHAKERNAYIQTLRRDMPDTGSGLSNDEADDILTMFQVNGKTAVMERLHQRLMGITATTRREMLESELITQDEYDQMESQYENYVPLRGFEEVDQNGERTSVQRGGRGFNIRGKETTRALGRRTRAGNIIENIVLDYERAVFRGERNMVGQTFLELIRTNPDPKLWEIDAERTRVSFNRQTGRVNKSREVDSGPNTVAIKVKGREVYVKVYDERLLRAMRKASKDDTGAIEHFINSTAGQFTALLRATLTQYNPVFAFVNAIRDIQSGGVAVLDELGTKGVALYAKHYRAALASAGRHQLGKLSPSGSSGMFFGNPTMDRYFEEYRAAGGTTGGYYGKSAEDVQQEIRNVLLAAGASPKTFAEKLKTMGGTSAGRRIMRGVQSTGKVLEFLGATSENAARVAAYRAARELGKSPAEAASIAKNLTTNFNRKGEWGQAINGAYLFFNAAVQGSHRTLKALKRGRVQALMAGMTATGMASVMLALAVGGDDEDDGQPYWDKIPTFEKERNFIIMLPPGSDMDGTEKVGSNGRYIKIPMPYGFNVFPMLGVQIADVIRNAKDETQGVTPGRGAINMLNAIMGSYNPLGGAIELEDGKRASSVMQAVFPTIGDIIVQQSLGVDGFSRPTSPFKSEFDLDPDSENANVRQAGSVWHMLARSLNTATGGSQAEPGAIDVSPGSLQNLWKNMTGGTGTFLSDVFVNLPTKFFEPEAEITSRDVPLLRNFYGQVDGMNDQSLLYERRREIQRAKTYEKNRADLDMEPTTDPTEVALASLASLSSKFTKEMSKLRREEIDIADDAEMSTAQKNLRKKEIKLERDRLAREFNAAYMDAMRAKRDGEFDQ